MGQVHGSRLGRVRYMVWESQVHGLRVGSDLWFRGGVQVNGGRVRFKVDQTVLFLGKITDACENIIYV